MRTSGSPLFQLDSESMLCPSSVECDVCIVPEQPPACRKARRAGADRRVVWEMWLAQQDLNYHEIISVLETDIKRPVPQSSFPATKV